MSVGTMLVRRFRRAVPDHILIDVLETVYQAYPVAWQQASDYHPKTARNHYPAERLALVADGLRAMVKRHPELSGADQNTRSGGYTYFEVACGPVVMTAHAVESTRQFPRHAEFRQALAGCNYHFFEEFVAREDDGRLYAMIVHAPHPKNLAQPGFVWIGLPDTKARKWMGRIDLFATFPDVTARLRGVAVEAVEQEAQVRPRRKQRRAQDGDSAS